MRHSSLWTISHRETGSIIRICMVCTLDSKFWMTTVIFHHLEGYVSGSTINCNEVARTTKDENVTVGVKSLMEVAAGVKLLQFQYEYQYNFVYLSILYDASSNEYFSVIWEPQLKLPLGVCSRRQHPHGEVSPIPKPIDSFISVCIYLILFNIL